MKNIYSPLIDFYMNNGAFRVGIRKMISLHKKFLKNINSRCYALWNDENVEFCKGIVYTAYFMNNFDDYMYDYICNVLNRYKSYNFTVFRDY